MPQKKKSKKANELEEQLLNQILKQEEELKAKKEAEKQKQEQEAKEKREQRRTEIRNRVVAEEKVRLENKLRELKEFYEKKYQEKLDFGVTSVEKAKGVTTIQSEDLMATKYGYNVVLGDHIFPIENAYSTVSRVNRRNNEEPLACRSIVLSKAPPPMKKNLEEIGYKIMSFLVGFNQPGLVRIMEVFLCYEKLHIIQEFASDSLEMYLRIGAGINEVRVRQFAKDVGEGLAFLHSHGIAHRNVNKSSVQIDRNTNGAKLGDFEYCCVFWRPGVKEFLLHPPILNKDTKYIPHEARKDKAYDVRKADVWCWADLVVYMLTKAHAPEKNFDTYCSEKLKHVSEEGLDCLKKCFVAPEERPDMKDVITQPWFNVYVDLVVGGGDKSPPQS